MRRSAAGSVSLSGCKTALRKAVFLFSDRVTRTAAAAAGRLSAQIFRRRGQFRPRLCPLTSLRRPFPAAFRRLFGADTAAAGALRTALHFILWKTGTNIRRDFFQTAFRKDTGSFGNGRGEAGSRASAFTTGTFLKFRSPLTFMNFCRTA